jgi:hypothetical protein
MEWLTALITRKNHMKLNKNSTFRDGNRRILQNTASGGWQIPQAALQISKLFKV